MHVWRLKNAETACRSRVASSETTRHPWRMLCPQTKSVLGFISPVRWLTDTNPASVGLNVYILFVYSSRCGTCLCLSVCVWTRNIVVGLSSTLERSQMPRHRLGTVPPSPIHALNVSCTFGEAFPSLVDFHLIRTAGTKRIQYVETDIA